MMLYLTAEQELRLRKVCADLYDRENISCTCGKVSQRLRGWVSQAYIGIEAEGPCACGRGRLSVSTDRHQGGKDLLKYVSRNDPNTRSPGGGDE